MFERIKKMLNGNVIMLSLLRGKLSITDDRLMMTINIFDITWTRLGSIKKTRLGSNFIRI